MCNDYTQISPKFIGRLLIALAKSAALDGNASEAREYASLAIQVMTDNKIGLSGLKGAIDE